MPAGAGVLVRGAHAGGASARSSGPGAPALNRRDLLAAEIAEGAEMQSPYASLAQRLLEHVRGARLFPDPGTALLAVSGGPDSLALLDLLHRIAAEIPLSLALAHVDHGIQADSGAVAEQVAAIGERYGLPVQVERLALGSGASETRARRARYGALRTVQRRVGARYLVTAHQADDQIETILYRLVRGSGIVGLSGIRALGPYGLVRPLLPFFRRELEDWLQQRFPDPATRPPVHRDPSNADPRHDRSWIRLRVLPVLRDRFGERLDRRLLDLAAHATSEGEAWAATLRALPDLDFRFLEGGAELSLEPLRRSEPALAEAVLRALAREAGCVLGPRRSARLLRFLRTAASGRCVELGEGFVAEVVFGRLRLRRPAADAATAPAPAQLGHGNEGRLVWGGFDIAWRHGTAEPPARAGWTTWLAPGSGMVRTAASGDRLVPLGGTGHRAVRRLLMEARVPKGDRSTYPVILWNEALAWVPGVCRGQAAVPQPGAAAVRLEVRHVGTAVGATDSLG